MNNQKTAHLLACGPAQVKSRDGRTGRHHDNAMRVWLKNASSTEQGVFKETTLPFWLSVFKTVNAYFF